MAGLAFLKILCLLIFSVNTVVNANNTTQFDNFTIVWYDFNLLTCAVPTTVNISLFTCLPSAAYTQVNDIDCLQETTTVFDQTTCSSPTTAAIPTSSTTQTSQAITARAQTSASMLAVTSQSITTAVASGITNSPLTSVTTTTTPMPTITVTSNGGVSTAVTAATPGSSFSNPNTIHGSTATITDNGSVSVSITSVTPGSSSISTTTSASSSNTNTTQMSASTITSNVNVHTTVASATHSSGSVSMATSTSTSNANTATTTTAGNMYTCQTDAYIGTYCNISSDACAMSKPCRNAAACFPNNTLPYGYGCYCLTGYTGYNCEYDERACIENTCWNNGTCIPMNTTVAANNGSDFKCECVVGYDGIHCELEMDLCGNITCENRGVCFTSDLAWKCLCLDASLYYGEYCQYKTGKLKLKEILSKSFASIAIGAIVTTCAFIVIMDVLKYAFHIDPVECERESYRRRLEARRRGRRIVKNNEPKFALRFQYIS